MQPLTQATTCMQVLAPHAAVEAARNDVQRLEAHERDVREVLQARHMGGSSFDLNHVPHMLDPYLGVSAAACFAKL